MHILSLELHRNRRLLVRGLHTFKINFEDLLQMLLGTNGSGKTTVMRECGPFFKPDDYAVGGYKIIKIAHEGRVYALKFHKEDVKKVHYEFFIDDGENLNQARLVTAHRQLVEKHFRLTEDLMDVFMGVKHKRFTNMSALKRREWLMMISGDDLEYAFKVHQKLRDKLRETTTIIKHNLQRVAKLKEGAQHDITELRNNAERITLEIEHLQGLQFNHRQPSTPEQLDGRLKHLMRSVDEVSGAILLIDVSKPEGLEQYRFDSVDSIQAVIDRLQGFRQSTMQQRTVMTEEFNRVQELLSANSEDNQLAIANLKAAILKDDAYLETLTARFTTLPYVEEPAQAFKDFTAVNSTLSQVVEEFPDNFDNWLNKERFIETNNLASALRLKIDQLTKEKENLFHELDHFKKTESVDCPKCDHSFKPKMQHINPAFIEKRIEVIVEELKVLEATLDDADDYLKNCNGYLSSKTQLNQLINGYPRLSTLWGMFGEAGYTAVSKRFLGLMNEWRVHCLNCIEFETVQQRLNENRSVVNRALELQAAADSGVVERAKLLEEALRSNTVSLKVTDAQIDKLSKYRNNLKRFLDGREKIKTYMAEAKQQYQMLNETVFNRTLADYLLQHRAMLSEVMTIINNAEMLDSLLKDIDSQNELLQKRQQAIEQLQAALSPATGLIARRVSTFINCFVEQINLLIAEIWTHPLTVQPCGFKSGEVDYKFPMVVHDSDLVISDVSEGSDSQVDFVDFAHRIVSMMYLNMEGYPLYVDELAPSLDETHRINLVGFLKRLIETKKCSQMFMISHYASTHQAFTNFQTCVLDTSNMINLPKVYNEHVVMQYA